MAYTFTTDELAVPFMDKFEEMLVIPGNSSKQLKDKFRSGTGRSMDVIVPDYPEVGTSLDIVPGSQNIADGVRNITLEIANVFVDADAIVRALDLHNFDAQIATPWMKKLCSAIQIREADYLKETADAHFVLSGTDYFAELSEAIGHLDSARSFGRHVAALNPIVNNKIAASGLKLFNPSEINKGLYKKSAIGEFSGVDFYKTPDVQALVTGDLQLGTATVNATLLDGATSLVIDDAGLAGGEVIVAGTVLNIAGVDAVDIYGDSIGTSYAFVVQSDATAVAGQVTVSIKPVTTVKPLTNVSALPVAGAVVTQVHDADSRYLPGVIWDEQSYIFANGKFEKVSNTSESTIEKDNLALAVMKGALPEKRTEFYRIDTLSKGLLVRTNHAIVIWIKE